MKVFFQFDDSKNKILRKESWETLEELYEKGLVKAIGVSNYNLRHLKELLSYCKIKPHVNQIEVHPHYQQMPLVEFCQGENIHVTAYRLNLNFRSQSFTYFCRDIDEGFVSEFTRDHNSMP